MHRLSVARIEPARIVGPALRFPGFPGNLQPSTFSIELVTRAGRCVAQSPELYASTCQQLGLHLEVISQLLINFEATCYEQQEQ